MASGKRSIKIQEKEEEECSVCCEAYNKSTHQKISCEHSGVCEFEACKSCIRTYLLGTTNDPNCMQCNKGWSDKFLAKQLNTSFLRTEYSLHRKELLVQQQISRMPETMAAAESYKRIKMIETQITALKDEFHVATLLCGELNHAYSNLSLHPTDDQLEDSEKLKKMKEELKKGKETKDILSENMRNLLHAIALIQNGGSNEEKKDARRFIMPCTNAECRGFLSPQYKCELCEHHTCAKCFEHIGLVKEDGLQKHECNPENIESADFIRKQSKPCPCCGIRISKIDGCDQMWCTQCHKAFSWNTGKIITGVVHNPHFYQYQREHGGGVAPRNPGDVVDCGGLCDTYSLHNLFHARDMTDINSKEIRATITKTIETLFNIHRLQRHFTATYIEPLRQNIQAEQDYEKERIQYIVQEISRKEMATKIIRKDNARKKHVAILHICELFTSVAIDMFRMIIASEKKGVELIEEITRHIAEYDTLRQYCNEQMKEVSMVYGVCVPQFSEKWTNTTSKFTGKGETDKYIAKRDEQRRLKDIAKEKMRVIAEKERESRIKQYNALRNRQADHTAQELRDQAEAAKALTQEQQEAKAEKDRSEVAIAHAIIEFAVRNRVGQRIL
jgi:hypothetical protein